MASERDDTTGRTRGMEYVDRRRFLKTTGVLTTAGLAAGCTSGGGSGQSNGGGSGQPNGGATKSSNLKTFQNKAGVKVGATFEAVKALAKEEDGATVYATIETEAFNKWLQGFHETYPEVQINHITGGSETLIARWDSEYKTNNVNADMYISTSNIKRTWLNGQVMKLKPDYMPSFGEAPDKFKDDQNFWLATRQVLGSIFYNTEMVDSSAASDWTDIVTDDRWSGQKIGWDPTPNQFLMKWLFDTQGREFFEKLRQQRPRFIDSHTDLARFCGAGEFPVAMTYTHKMGEFGKRLPISYFKWDPLPSVISPGVINNKAPSPNSTLLFFNWLASAEGQEVLGSTAYIPWHPEAEYTGYPGVYPSEEYNVDTISPSINISQIRQKWKNIMGDLI